MSINWKVRMKSPAFWLGIAGAAAMPALAYLGLGYEDMTTRGGVGDSERALGYGAPPGAHAEDKGE